jgi:hypothetical protein
VERNEPDRPTTATLAIAVLGRDRGESDRLSVDLARELIDEVPDASLERARKEQDAQDLGAILTVVLVKSGALLAISKAVGSWIQSHQEVELELTKKDADGNEKKLRLVNVNSEVAERTTRTFFDA